MKFSYSILLALMVLLNSVVFAQENPTPTPSESLPSSQQDLELRQVVGKERMVTIAAMSQKNQKDFDAAGKLMMSGKYEESINAWTNLIKLNLNLKIIYNNRGYCYLMLGSIDSAIDDFDKSLKLSPSGLTYSNRGLAFIKKGDPKAALADFGKAIEINPKDPLIYNNRADAYIQTRNYAAALEDQNRAVALAPKEALYISNRCFTLFLMNSFEQSIADCTAAIALSSKSALTFSTRGTAYFRISKFENALSDFDSALKIDSSMVNLHGDRGIILIQLGRYQEGIESLTKFIEVHPIASVFLYRASAYIELNKPIQAEMDFNRAIELEPNNPTAYNNRGVFFFSDGNTSRALQDYNRAIELDPKSRMTYRNRAVLYRQLGKTKEAEADEKTMQNLELKP